MNTVSPKMIEAGLQAIDREIGVRNADEDATLCQAIYTAMLNARDPYEEGDGWQPIETAPKDGTWVMVFGTYKSGLRSGVAQFRNEWSEPAWIIAEHYGPTKIIGLRVEAPTHWRKLPDPPRAAITALIQSEGGVRSSLDASADADRATHEPSQVSQSRPSVGIACAEPGQ